MSTSIVRHGPAADGAQLPGRAECIYPSHALENCIILDRHEVDC